MSDRDAAKALEDQKPFRQQIAQLCARDSPVQNDEPNDHHRIRWPIHQQPCPIHARQLLDDRHPIIVT
jgi:hypothetical protein